MYRYIIIALAALLPPTVAGAQARERTEAEVIAATVTGSAQLRAARTGAAAEALGPAQVTWPNPMLELMPMPAAILDGEPGAQLMARQPIPWRARLDGDRTARARQADAAAFEAAALELELVAMARMTYAELWGLQEQAARIREFTRQLELYRDAALAQYAAGRGPQQAVLGIQVESGTLTQRLDALEEERAELIARLVALTGGTLRLEAGDRLAPPAAARTPAPDAAVLRAAVHAHPAVEAGRAGQAAELAMAAMTRTMLRPEFTVGVNLNLSRMAFDRMYGAEPVMPAIGVMLPLRRGGIRAQVEAAELRATQRELETADTEVQLLTQAEALLEQLGRVRQRVSTYERTLRPQVRQTLDASLAGYQAGTTRFLELLDAQRMALDVELDLIMARVREAGLHARLDAVAALAPGGTVRPDERN